MENFHDLGQAICQTLLSTASKLAEFDEEFDPQVRIADEKFGDFQANGILPFAKKKQVNPRKLGEKLLQSMPESVHWKITLSGPGFLNFKLTSSLLLEWVLNHGSKEVLRDAFKCKDAGIVVLDFSSPNTAKQMHVGHIRSTIIGDSLGRLLSFRGHQVIRDNHLGDWGTQFGILLYAIKREGIDLNHLGKEPISELESLYRKGNNWVREDEKALSKARDELVKLQHGDRENLRMWQKIRDLSMCSFEKIYQILGVRFDHTHGESFYRDQVDSVYRALNKHKICEEDEGALVVFHSEHKRFAEQPFIIRKSDGASNYATSDLATISYRSDQWKADQVIYVTDGRQRDHFEQLFLTTKKWFALENRKLPLLKHIWFGTILGEDNKAIKTRDGQPIKLSELLEEAIKRAAEMVTEKSSHLPESEIHRRAKVIGLGAVKYADLSQDRTLDYVFSWEKLLALQGNTAPYLQYAVARILSIFRKMPVKINKDPKFAREPETAQERRLARKLVFFPIALKQTDRESKPHFLCCYLFELATDFSSFYSHDKVMVEDISTRNLRILLCDRTLTFLRTGLEILGIETLEEM